MRVDEGNGNALTHGYDSTAKFLLQVARWKHDYDYGAPAGGNQLVDTCPVRVKDVPKVSSRPMDDDAVQLVLSRIEAEVPGHVIYRLRLPPSQACVRYHLRYCTG